MKSTGERVESKLRAALVPLASLDLLRGVEEARACRAAAVSLGEGRPTHLLVVADVLPPAFAGAAARIDGTRLFFGPADRAAFAEGAETPPAGESGWLTFRLRGVDPCLRLRGEQLRPLEESLEAAWKPVPAATMPLVADPVELRLRVSGDLRPATGLVLSGEERRQLDEILSAWPESRFEGVRFAAGAREIFLWAREPGLLEGLPGAAFHAVDLGGGRSLQLPAGRDLELPFARAVLPRLLGDGGEVYFWLEKSIVALPSGRLRPLTRREWRARGGSP